MLYINNNNSRSDECSYAPQSNSNTFYNYQNQPNTHQRYQSNFISHFDYSDLLKTDEAQNLALENSNINQNYDNNRFKSSENLRNFNSVGLNSSDDEALEHYLSDLAKNYDDIDRRIRNAEKFVSQIEEAQHSSTNMNLTHNQIHQQPIKKSVKNNCSSFNRSDDLDNINNKVKYVTELRVNIADNLANEHLGSKKDGNNYLLNDNHLNQQKPMMKSNLLGFISPSFRKSSTPLMGSEPTPTFRSQTTNFCSNYNTHSTVPDSVSPKSKSSSHSHSTKIELDQVNIPPPTSFNTNYYEQRIIESCVKNKEVQTVENMDFKSTSYGNTIMEERSVQTVSPLSCMVKATVDTGVGTENKYHKPKRRISQSKSISTSKHVSEMDDSDYSITDKSFSQKKNQRNNSVSSNSESDNAQDSKSRSNSTPVCRKYAVNTNASTPNSFGNIKTIRKKHQHSKTIGLTSKNTNTESHFPSTHKINVTEKRKVHKQNTKTLNKAEYLEAKDTAKNASFEIQRLLENLGTHLQATMSIREPKSSALNKTPISTESSSASFWDNPLHKHDLITHIKSSANKRSSVSKKPAQKVHKTKSNKTGINVINSELQAICKTIENDNKYEETTLRLNNSYMLETTSDSEDKESSILKSDEVDKHQLNQLLLGNVSCVSRNIVGGNKKSNSSMNLSGVQTSVVSTVNNTNATTQNNIVSGSNNTTQSSNISTLKAGGDNGFPGNFKATRTFELSPYDDLIKSHLSPCDRRVKAVAAKNGCKICIDGPINVYDPSSCQAFRNKVTYRCIIAGQSKDNLDKCMNYLKETFPNTFLRINQRSN